MDLTKQMGVIGARGFMTGIRGQERCRINFSTCLSSLVVVQPMRKTGCDGKNRCVSSIHSASERPLLGNIWISPVDGDERRNTCSRR